MAGKAKSCYLTIVDAKTYSTHKTVFTKVFFDAKSMNNWIKDDPKMQEYPSPTFYIVKETY